jgi:FtsH-binding integral membrane protein
MLRRCLVVLAFAFWQGGFAFYGSVVVPVGRSILDPPLLQSQVTRTVSGYMHAAAAVVLVLLLWDMMVVADPRRRVRWRWVTWGTMVVCLAAMVWLRMAISEMMDAGDAAYVVGSSLRAAHKAYMGAATLQWLCATVWLCLTLVVWRGEDRGERV